MQMLYRSRARRGRRMATINRADAEAIQIKGRRSMKRATIKRADAQAIQIKIGPFVPLLSQKVKVSLTVQYFCPELFKGFFLEKLVSNIAKTIYKICVTYAPAAVLRFIHPPRCSHSNMCFANHWPTNEMST